MNKLAVGMFAAILLLIGGTVYILVREGDRVPLSASVINPEQLFGRANATVTTKARTVPVQSVDLSFPHNNLLPEAEIAEVLVRQGDKVEKGAPLARLDTRVLEMRVAESQAALAQAKANYDKLLTGASPEQIAEARAQVAKAQGQMRETKGGATGQYPAAAKADLAEAQASLQVLEAGPKDTAVRSAQASLDQARARLETQRDSLSATKTQAQLLMEQNANILRSRQ